MEITAENWSEYFDLVTETWFQTGVYGEEYVTRSVFPRLLPQYEPAGEYTVHFEAVFDVHRSPCAIYFQEEMLVLSGAQEAVKEETISSRYSFGNTGYPMPAESVFSDRVSADSDSILIAANFRILRVGGDTRIELRKIG